MRLLLPQRVRPAGVLLVLLLVGTGCGVADSVRPSAVGDDQWQMADQPRIGDAMMRRYHRAGREQREHRIGAAPRHMRLVLPVPQRQLRFCDKRKFF